MIMPFRLSSAPTTFIRLTNHVSRKHIGLFVVVFFEDCLVYNRTFDDHVEHLRALFKTLCNTKLYEKLKKCHFFQESVFLGYIISSSGIKVDEAKRKVIKDWSKPTSIVDVRSFHGLASFYKFYSWTFDRMFEKKKRVLVEQKWTKIFWVD